MKVLSIYNRKGGVGKTSICSALAMFYSAIGKKVLCLDLDSQMNLSLFLCGFQERSTVEQCFENNIGKVLINEDFDIQKAIYKTGEYEIIDADGERKVALVRENKNLYFIPGAPNLTDIESDLSKDMSRFPQLILKEKFRSIQEISPDIVLIDNAPSESLLAVMSLAASDGVIEPITPDLNAVVGLKMCKTIIHNVQRFNSNLKDLGCVLNNYKTRESVSQYTKEVIEEDESLGYTGISIRTASKIPFAILTTEGVVNTERYLKKLPQSQKVADEIIKLAEYIDKEL